MKAVRATRSVSHSGQQRSSNNVANNRASSVRSSRSRATLLTPTSLSQSLSRPTASNVQSTASTKRDAPKFSPTTSFSISSSSSNLKLATPLLRRHFATSAAPAPAATGALLGSNLCQAAATGDLDVVKKLVSQGGSTKAADYDKRTALHLAAAEGHLSVCDFLIKHGADVNAVDRFGGTPLVDAVRSKHEIVARLLQASGAKSSSGSLKELGARLCEHAAAGDLDNIRMLIQNGTPVNVSDYDHRTPLHLAASEGQFAVVDFLISNGANVNAIDRFGNTPLVDACRKTTVNHKKVVKLLEQKGGLKEGDLKSFKHAPDFNASLQRALPLLCERGNWEFAEAWITSDEDNRLIPSTAWFAPASRVNQLLPLRKASEAYTYESNQDAIMARVWKSKQPEWTTDLSNSPKTVLPKDMLSLCRENKLRSMLALPILHNEAVVAVLLFFGTAPRAQDDKLTEQFSSFACRLIMAGIASSVKKDTLVAIDNVNQEQMNEVHKLIVDEGVFNSSVVFQEIDWWYNSLGIQQYYFDHYTPAQIAKHIHAFIGAKKVAETTGDRENVNFKMYTNEGAFFLLSLTSTRATLQVEKEIEKYLDSLETTADKTPYTMTFFASRGPSLPNGNARLGLYIIEKSIYVENADKVSPTETDIWKVSTGIFLRNKIPRIRDRYAAIIAKAVNTLAPVIEVYEPSREGTIPIMIATQRSHPGYLSELSEVLSSHNMIVERKFVEKFANGVTIFSVYVQPRPKDVFEAFVNQVSLLYHVPVLPQVSPMFYDGVFSAEEVAYSFASMRFAYHFIQQRSDEFLLLRESLKGDTINLSRLNTLQKELKRDAVTQARIEECVANYPDLVKELYKDFQKQFNPAINTRRVRQLNKDLLPLIKKTVTNELDEQILSAFHMFNNSVLKTNFFKDNKAAISFRLDPAFLKNSDFPEVPFGIFMVLGSDFRGFHLRFRDVARGGIRIVKSGNKIAYSRNLESLLMENYGLAYTQQKKNKDIPEGGSKGTILVSLNCRDPEMSFKCYVDGLLDLLLPNEEVLNHYGHEEILFLGPDEWTAGLMDWAALHAKKRAYPFWKAFTTGKSPAIGGIPHDTYGMTTRSIHRFVLGTLAKKGLEESSITKVQTGGPDGDLGSNEVLISKDKTIAIVDGSGVVYDANGLDRTELKRLAEKRAMINEFNIKKLGSTGFKVLIGDRDVKLPNGENVESGLTFRNEFHLNNLAEADLFVPCGGRPESVNIKNVHKLFKADGTPKFKFIIEGANLFLTNDARLVLEKKGVVIYKDASANKGGVTSSSLEVLAALSLSDQEAATHMTVREDGTRPDFYKRYVEEVQRKVESNADLEFECIWAEHERTKTPRHVLTDVISDKINTLNDYLMSEPILWNNRRLRSTVLKQAIPRPLLDLVGLDTIQQRVPERYLRAIFGSHLSSRYIYKYGLSSSELTFFEFMQQFAEPEAIEKAK